MPPELAAPLALLIAALAQAVLMYAAWRWPRGYHRRGGSDRNEPDDEE